MRLGSIIRRYRREHNYSLRDMAKLLDVSYSYVTMLEKGRNPNTGRDVSPTIETFNRIAQVLKIEPSMLLKMIGSSADEITEESEQPALANTFELADSYRVPVIGSVRCGPGGPAYEYIDDEYVAIDASYSPSMTRGFHIEGDSMEGDHIYDGDIAIVRIQPEVEDGQLAVVVVDGEEGTLKHVRIRYDYDGALAKIILESSNPKYPPRVFSGEDINRVHIVGRVVETRRQR